MADGSGGGRNQGAAAGCDGVEQGGVAAKRAAFIAWDESETESVLI